MTLPQKPILFEPMNQPRKYLPAATLTACFSRLRKQVLPVILLAFLLLAGSGGGHLQAQSTSQVTIVGIPPILPSPFADDIENDFTRGQYQIIFNYSSFTMQPVDFIFEFTVSKNNKEIIEIASLPMAFVPGAHVFTSFFEELVFPQGADDVFQQLDTDTRMQLIQTGMLPEAQYRIQITARPAFPQPRMTILPGLAHFTVRYPSPPILVSPPDNANVLLDVPVFSWTPVVNTAGFQIHYDFLLVEIHDGQTPLQAINSNRAHASEVLVGTTTMPYTPQFLPLEVGARYAWQVIARESMGRMPLQNDGRSEIATFTYHESAASVPLADISDLEEIPIIPQFAMLIGLDALSVTEHPAFYEFNGSATLALDFDGVGTFESQVNVSGLMIQKQSLSNPILMGGSLSGPAQFVRDLLTSLNPLAIPNPWIEFVDLSWSFGGNIEVSASLQTPDQQWLDAEGTLALDRTGVSGSVEISGDPLAEYSESFLEFTLFSVGASFPDNRLWATGNAQVTGVQTPCEISNFNYNDGVFQTDILCTDPFQIPLGGDTDLLLLDSDRLMGSLAIGIENNQFDFDVQLRTTLGFKTANDRYCGSRLWINMSSEDGMEVTSSGSHCPDLNPKIDLGFAMLQFTNAELVELVYDAQEEEWNFELQMDAALEVEAFDSWASLVMTDIRVNREGITFDEIRFHDQSHIRPLPVFNAGLFQMQVSQFRLNSFIFPLFDWDGQAPGPWDIAFEGNATVRSGVGAPPCLIGTTLQLTDGRIDQERVATSLALSGFDGCEWQPGPGVLIQIDGISGEAGVEYPSFDEIRPFGRLDIAGSITAGAPFLCDDAQPIAFDEGALSVSDGITGTLQNIIPGCPLRAGPFEAQVTRADIVFSLSDTGDQQAVMNLDATLSLPEDIEVDGTAVVDLIAGEILSASFIMDTPFDWHIPSPEAPALTFRIDYAEITGDGFSVNGRHQLTLPESSMGVTFEDFVIDLEHYVVRNGRVIFDDAFALEAGISDDNDLLFRAVETGSALTLETGVLLELAGTIVIDTTGLTASGTAEAQVAYGAQRYESAVTVTYTDDFSMGFQPFGVNSGQADFFFEGNRFAFVDPAGFHPVLAFFAEMLIPERLPLPTEDIAYLQLRNGEDLLVGVEEDEDGNFVLSTLPNEPLSLVVPYLNPASPPTLANISLNDLTIGRNPHSPEVISGSISVDVPPNDPLFNLGGRNIPLVVRTIEYGTRMVNNMPVQALYMLGNLNLLGQELEDDAEVAFYIRGDGYVRADFDVQNMDARLVLAPAEPGPSASAAQGPAAQAQQDPSAPEGQVVVGVDGVRGTFEMMIGTGASSFNFFVDGSLEILTDQGYQAGADLTIQARSDGFTAITEFEPRAFGPSLSRDFGSFRLGLDRIISIHNFSFTTDGGFTFSILFDMFLHIPLDGGGQLDFPLREIEIRNDGFFIPTQDISEGTIPGLDLPKFDLAGFEIKPLALRTSPLSWNWNEAPAIGPYLSMDFSVMLPEMEGTGLVPPDGILILDAGYDNGYLTGSVQPIGFPQPVDIPLIPGPNPPRLLIDQIAGALEKISEGDGFRQILDIEVTGRIGELPAFHVDAPETCPDTQFTLSIVEGRAFEGSLTGIQPCGYMEWGPVKLEVVSADLQFYMGEDGQEAELDGTVEVTLPGTDPASPLVVTGNLVLDVLSGAVKDGAIAINQPFALNMPLMESDNPLFTFGIEEAVLNSEGLIITGQGVLVKDDVNASVVFENLAIGLDPFEILGGSATIAADFSMEIIPAPFSFGLVQATAPMPDGDALRMDLSAEVVLDADGLAFGGQSQAVLQYGGELYSNLRVEFVDDFAMNISGLSVSRGRVEFYWDQDDQPADEPIAYVDESGFHLGAGLVALLPARLPLPTMDIAYIRLRDDDGNPYIEAETTDTGYILSTNDQYLPIVIPALSSAGDTLTAGVNFTLQTDGAFNVTGGSLSLQSNISVQDRLNLPVTITELTLIVDDGVTLNAGLRFQLPAVFNGHDADVLAAITQSGITSAVVSVGTVGETYDPALEPLFTFSTSGQLADASGPNAQQADASGPDTFSAGLLGIEASFGATTSLRFSGILESSLVMDDGDIPLFFRASWIANAWEFDVDPGSALDELHIGQASIQLDAHGGVSLVMDEDLFYVSINGQVSFEEALEAGAVIAVQELEVGVSGYQSQNPSLHFALGQASAELGALSFSLFEGALAMTLSNPSIVLAGREIAVSSDGSIAFLEQDIAFTGLQLSTAGSFALDEVSISEVPIFEDFLVLESFALAFGDEGVQVEAGLRASLPAPVQEYEATGILRLYRDQNNLVQVDNAGLIFEPENLSFELAGFGAFHLTKVMAAIDPFTMQEAGLYANGHITVPSAESESESDPVIFFGQAANFPDNYGIGISRTAQNGQIEVGYNITGSAGFELDVSFFRIAVNVDMSASAGGEFKVMLSGQASFDMQSVDGSLDYSGIVITEEGLTEYGNISAGAITVAGVANLEIGQFVYEKNENGFEITLANTSDEEPDPEGLREGNYDDVETGTITVIEALCFGPCNEFGGNSDTRAINITIGADPNNPTGGFGGGVDKILFYRTAEGLRSLTIENARLQLDDIFKMTASINYIQVNSDVLLRAAATGEFDISGAKAKAIVAGKFANINNQVSFGLFVAVEAGAGIPIVPGVVTLTGAGGGFFYRPVAEDLSMVHTALANFGHALVNESAASIQGEADFAIMLYASIGIAGGSNAYVMEGSTYFQITSQAFYMDARADVLGMDGENSVASTKVAGEMSAHITRQIGGGFTMAISVAVVIEVPNVLDGSGGISFFMNKASTNSQVIWGIVGHADFSLFGGILDGGGVFLAGNPGFMLQVNLGFYADIAIMSIQSSLEGAVWIITDPKYQYPFGAYIEFSVEASLMGLASVSATAQAAFVNKNPGYMFFAAVYGCVGTLLGDACSSAWFSLEVPGGINFGLGQNANSNLIAQAQAMLDDFQDHILSLMAGIDGALDALNRQRPPAFEVAGAEDARQAGINFYSRDLYLRAGWDEQIHDPVTVQSLPAALQAVRSNVMLGTDPEHVGSSANYTGIATSAIRILEGLRGRIDTDMMAAYELEETAQASYEALLSAVTGSPVRNVIIPEPVENASQGVHFEVDDQLATTHATGFQQYQDELALMEAGIRRNISMVLSSLDEMGTLLQSDDPVAEDNHLINLANWYSRAHIELEKTFAYESDIAYKRIDWSDQLVNYLNTNQSAIHSASDDLANNLISVVNAGRSNFNSGISGTYGTLFEQARRMARRDYFIRHMKELPSAHYGFFDLDPASSSAPLPTQGLYNTLVDVNAIFYNEDGSVAVDRRLTDEEQDMLRDLNRNFWWEMNHGGLSELNTAYWEAVSAMRWRHQEERVAIFTPLIEMTQILDDFYSVRAGITSILYNMIDEYLQWKAQPVDADTRYASESQRDQDESALDERDPDERDVSGPAETRPDAAGLVLGGNQFDSYEELRRFLAIQLQPPSITDISISPAGISTNYFRATDIDWVAIHQDAVVETSITVEYGGTGPADMLLTGIGEFMSVGNRDGFTIYPYKTGDRQFQNITFRLRARGPAGNTAIRTANFRVTVDPWADPSDVSINTPSGSVVPEVTWPPAEPVLHLENYYHRGPGPDRDIETAFWTATAENITLEVSALDTEAGIGQWEYSIGTTQGGTDVMDWTLMQGPVQHDQNTMAQVMIAPALSFTMEPGVPYFISVRVENTLGQKSPVHHAEPVIYDPVALNAITHDRIPTSIQQPGTDVTEIHGPIAALSLYEKNYDTYLSWSAKSSQRFHFRNMEAFTVDPRAEIPDGGPPVNYSGLSYYEYVLTGDESIPAHQFGQLSESFTGDELVIHDPDFEIGEDIYWHVRAVTHSGIAGEINTFGPYQLIDYTLPETGIMRAKPYPDKIRVFVTEPPFDPESDLLGIQHAIGTNPKGGSYLRPFPAGSDVDLEWDWNRSRGLYLANNVPYHNRFIEVSLQEIEALGIKEPFYIFFRSVNTQGMTSNIAATGPLMIDTTPPPPATVELRYNTFHNHQQGGVLQNRFRVTVSNITDPESGVLKVEYWVERRPNATAEWSDISSLTAFEHFVLVEYDVPEYGTINLNPVFSPSLNFNNPNTEYRIKVRITNGSGLTSVQAVHPSNTPFIN